MIEKKLPFNFYLLIISRLTSTLGTFLSMIAVNILILEITGSPTWVAVAMAVKVISGMLVSPFIGLISDRYNRKNLMIISEAIMAIALIALVFMESNYLRNYLIILMSLIGIFSNLFEVCLNSSIPTILDNKNILKANSFMMVGRNIMIGLSGLLAVFANYLFKNYNSIFIIDAATYIFSAIVLIALKIKTSEERDITFEELYKKLNFIQKLKTNYQPIAKLKNFKIIVLLLAILFIDALASASHNVGWPIFSKIMNESEPMFYYGMIIAFWSLGNLLGIFFLLKISYLNSAPPEKLYVIFTAIMSFGMIMIFQTKITEIILFSSLIAGIGDGTYQVYYTTYIQKIDDKVRGKVFAITAMILRTGFGVGYIIVPLFLSYLSINKVVLFFHLIVILTVIYSLIFFKNNIRKN